MSSNPWSQLLNRYDWRDFFSWFSSDECPEAKDEPAEPAAPPTPIEALKQRALDASIRILDLRGVSRSQLYPANEHCVVRGGVVTSTATLSPGEHSYGTWGYFRVKRNGEWAYLEVPPTRGKAHGTRPWKKMTSTVVHTAAVTIDAARFIGIPSQHGIASDGTIVLSHPINAYMWHANAANKFSDGIEISGKGTITTAQSVAVQFLLRYIDEEKALQGVATRCITPHAFSQKRKPNDCGPAIWPVTGQWAQDTLGMKLGPVVGKGFQPDWVKGTPSK